MLDYNSVHNSINKLRQESTRWQAITELRQINDIQLLPIIISFINDKEWIIRLVIAEILVNFNDLSVIPTLIKLLQDHDFHVEKKAITSLKILAKTQLDKLIPYLGDKNLKTRLIIAQIIVDLTIIDYDLVKNALLEYNYIIANRLLEILSRKPNQDIIELLIFALNIKATQKTAIILLGESKNTFALPFLIKLAQKKSYLKRIILENILKIAPIKGFELIIKEINKKSYNNFQYLHTTITEFKKDILPYLLISLQNEHINRNKLIKLMENLDLSDIANEIHELAREDKKIRDLTRNIRKKYPYNLQKSLLKQGKLLSTQILAPLLEK